MLWTATMPMLPCKNMALLLLLLIKHTRSKSATQLIESNTVGFRNGSDTATKRLKRKHDNS